MTPAELKTLREGLGLTQQWLADQLSVQNRTIKYWESGFYPVKKDVEEMLLSINEKFNEIEKNAIEVIKNSNSKHITLLRYSNDGDLWHFMPEFKPLPATAHASVIFRLLNKAEILDCNVTIVYMNKIEYLAWLDTRQDSDAMRSLWGSEQTTNNP
jgi:DNA-binding XRE family transcriptional regulator